MYNITLVCTQHKGCGNCNAAELYKIIGTVNPEIIFEELSLENFNKVYLEGILTTLESTAIKEYLKNNKIEHIPVDTFPLPSRYYEDLDKMYDKILHSNSIAESREIRNLLANHSAQSYNSGFMFLNSDENNKCFEEIDLYKAKILKILDNDILYKIRRLEKEVIEKREMEILSNIYEFSKINHYDRAIMFIGSGHRKSIHDLIKKFESQNVKKLSWNIY